MLATRVSYFSRLKISVSRTVDKFGSLTALLPLVSQYRMASEIEKPGFTNELIKERSPYLLQHAHNPVNWYPWGTKAFEKAKTENKPIFLSVGYSTCHWCHVMEHESFENEQIADILNKHFISVKVDREERPDVDKVYMTFIQATVGGGGWPMSVWLTPDLQPFYGGTYFPPQDQFFRPGFTSVLTSVAKEWEKKRSKIVESGASIIKALEKATSGSSGGKTVPDIKCATTLAKELSASFDEDKGGFGVNFSFLLRYHHANQSTDLGKKCLNMCIKTLDEMRKGGIHDHVSQGFHRYSTDSDWHVPHFEKMLYDQGQLAVAYSEAFMVTKDASFADIVRDILSYVNRDLSHEVGGFLSAEDADSYPTSQDTKKKEGAFCVWTHEEISEILSEVVNGSDVTLSSLFSLYYGVKKGGNVNAEQDPHGELTNQNVLIVRYSIEEAAEHFNLSPLVVKEAIDKACQKLRKVRSERPPPHLDTKILASWNGLMISGFCKGYQALGDIDYLTRAIKAATFVKNHLFDPDKKCLLRSVYCCGRDGPLMQIDQPISAFVDDYAFMTCALLDLYESSFDTSWLQMAEDLQQTQDELFWDQKNAGYFEVTTQDPTILLRMKEAQDGAEPSANSIAVSNLMRLSVFLNRPELGDKAVKILSCFEKRISQIPLAVPEMINGLFMVHKTPQQIVIVGDLQLEDTKTMVRMCQSRFLPNKVLIHCHGLEEDSSVFHRIPSLKTMSAIDQKPTVYICQNYTCSLPMNSVEDVEKYLLEKAHIEM